MEERPEGALHRGWPCGALGVGERLRHLPVVLLTLASEVHSMRQVRNVFETILKYGHDEDFAPAESEDFSATDAPAGSRDKLEVLARRIEQGLPRSPCEKEMVRALRYGGMWDRFLL